MFFSRLLVDIQAIFCRRRHQARRQARQDQAGKAKFSHPRLKKIASFDCGLTMSQGNSRTNGISDRKSNASPNCEHHQDIGHNLSSPSCARGSYPRFPLQSRSSNFVPARTMFSFRQIGVPLRLVGSAPCWFAPSRHFCFALALHQPKFPQMTHGLSGSP